jgi:5-methylcytosine-specific restriction protein A
MARKRPEWIGKTDDTPAPPRVRQRSFDAAKGICHWCELPIKVPAETWAADHVIAIINGGQNRETNLAPIHGHCHLEKTDADLADKKKVAKVRGKYTGAIRPKGRIASPPKPERPAGKAVLPRRPMFWPASGHSESGD